MQYKQIKVSSILNKITTKDKLFAGDYTLDPYQNCEFGCLYCDSSFDKTIYIKTNTVEILKNELKNTNAGRIIIGSVHDPYQNIEKKYKTTRRILEIIKEYDFSCHILTKSDLVLRDLEIISDIKDSLVTISLISLNKTVFSFFEKNVPSPQIRLQTIEKLKDAGIKTGLAVIPILPYVVEEELENIIKSAKKCEAEYLLHKHLELKGDQKTCFLDLLTKFNSDLVKKYEDLYNESYIPKEEYIDGLNKTVEKLCKKYKIKNKIMM